MAPKTPVDGKNTSLVVMCSSAARSGSSSTDSETDSERSARVGSEDSRVRKYHTRSRVGCLTCRKRHVKCDGNQPTCLRCVNAGRVCSFPPPDPPLRERRGLYLPGEQRPWSVTTNKLQPNLAKGVWCLDGVDPFECLPIRLPRKSAELLSYYQRINDSYDISSNANDKDIIPFLIQQPGSLRQTLLISGIHQMWLSGDTKTYQPTVLYHKVEAIQQLNKDLQNMQPKHYMSLIKQVSTLSIVEYAFGNMGSAETHMDSLVAILDQYSPMDQEETEITFEEEMSYRYLSLTYNVIHNMRSRMVESEDLNTLVSGSHATDLPAYYDIIMKLHAQDPGCLRIQLQAASMYPFFFADLPPTTKFHDIDDTVGIGCLRSLTDLFQLGKAEILKKNPQWGWTEGSLSRIHLAVMNSHVQSLFNTTDGAPVDSISGQKLVSCWFGVSVAHGFYLHSVLDTWNANEPMNRHLLRVIMKVYIRQQKQPSQRANMYRAPDLWFWQNFVTAYFLHQHQARFHDPDLKRFEDYFDSAIRDWSQVYHITHWDQAQRRLLRIAWPLNHPPEVPRRLWERAAHVTLETLETLDSTGFPLRGVV